MAEPTQLRGARILITGASSGIGKATALLLLRYGASVLATVRKRDDGQDLLDVGCGVTVMDVRDYAEHQRVLDTLGHVDVLINNAGYSYRASFEHGNENEIRALLDVNFLAPCALTRCVLPQMRARRQGAIVNISSVSGRVVQPLNGYYSATKHALEAVTEALAYEVRPFNVRVALIEPGRVLTSLHPRLHAEPRTYDDPDSPYAQLAQKLPARLSAGTAPLVVAETVVTALTAPAPGKLRWPATADAKEVLESRHTMDEGAFEAYFRQRLGIMDW